jgi:hypothetical protein
MRGALRQLSSQKERQRAEMVFAPSKMIEAHYAPAHKRRRYENLSCLLQGKAYRRIQLEIQSEGHTMRHLPRVHEAVH